VKHQISYNAADCEAKLNRLLYADSSVAKKTSCGRTKAEAIVTEVLGPKSVQQIVVDLTDSNPMMPKEFSIATDASKIKNRKMFPVCVQYFTAESGVTRKLLDFTELNDEHSAAVPKMLLESLTNNKLDRARVTAYAADNASPSVLREIEAQHAALRSTKAQLCNEFDLT
jgi:hypothetical protein